eukprot:SAG22_NODE_21175_length_259_cov_0.650000_1_plen_37_part_10
MQAELLEAPATGWYSPEWQLRQNEMPRAAPISLYRPA